jgi:ATP-dependent Lhr-like helicase
VVAAERLPELVAVHPDAVLDPPIEAPASRTAKAWTRADAIVELLRGRLSISGPATAAALAASLAIPESDADAALLALEGDGVVLRGSFSPVAAGSRRKAVEWCDRRLLARIHRYTLTRLRAEIAPVPAAEFMRFLFAWQHVEPGSQLLGAEGLRAVVTQLDGVELPARAWERDVLPARVERYDPSMLDMLCLTGEVAWARLSSGPTQVVGATPVALYLRANGAGGAGNAEAAVGQCAAAVLERLQRRGASFAAELAAACGLTDDEVRAALGELVAAGAVSSDGFAGRARSSAPRRPRRRDAGSW